MEIDAGALNRIERLIMKKLKRLKRKNGVQRKSISAGAFLYQKHALKKRARDKGMTVSYYINYILWSEWL